MFIAHRQRVFSLLCAVRPLGGGAGTAAHQADKQLGDGWGLDITNIIPFDELSLTLLGLIYAAAAAVIWFAGTRAARYANQISRRTGLGGILVGMVLLGSITSLPEIATSSTAALGGDAGLAVGNLLGGVAFQILILAIADALFGKRAVTSTIPNPGTLIQASILILLLALAVAGTVRDEPGLFGVGFWSTAILVAYVVSIGFVHRQERHAGWTPRLRPDERSQAAPSEDGTEQKQEGQAATTTLIFKLIGVAIAIFAAGYVLTISAEEMAGEMGIDTSIAGMTLVAIATSLPELSTATGSVRLGRNDMAVGDVLGGNMFDVMLIFLVDLLYAGPPVLGAVPAVAGFAGLLGIMLTVFYLIGMIERRDRTIFNMGYDSLLVLLGYVGGMALILTA